MTISLTDAGKRFNREWIFRHFSHEFRQGTSYAVTGPNGSGKSTLLQVISGAIHLSEGSMKFEEAGKDIKPESFYSHVSICAPYLELVEEMTLREMLEFHREFKPFLPGIDTDSIIDILGLQSAKNKQIRYYSSGMKQRVKLAQCIFSNTPVVLLDEPCTNLDVPGIELYHRLVAEYCPDRLVIVSSNDEVEYRFCEEIVSVVKYK